MNFWKQIPAGDNPPQLLNIVIEVTMGSRSKFEYCSQWEAFILNRVIPSSVVFPVEYGFVPQTIAQDGDPLDIMALTYEPLMVGAIAKVKVIGMLIMEDEEGLDYKILSVPSNDLRFKEYETLTDVPEYQLKEIAEFFTTYKRLEPCKWAKVRGWKGPSEAQAVVSEAIKNTLKKRNSVVIQRATFSACCFLEQTQLQPQSLSTSRFYHQQQTA